MWRLSAIDDSDNRLTQVQDPLGHLTTGHYDPAQAYPPERPLDTSSSPQHNLTTTNLD